MRPHLCKLARHGPWPGACMQTLHATLQIKHIHVCLNLVIDNVICSETARYSTQTESRSVVIHIGTRASCQLARRGVRHGFKQRYSLSEWTLGVADNLVNLLRTICMSRSETFCGHTLRVSEQLIATGITAHRLQPSPRLRVQCIVQFWEVRFNSRFWYFKRK